MTGITVDGYWRQWNREGTLLKEGQLLDVNSVTAVTTAYLPNEERNSLLVGQADGTWRRFDELENSSEKAAFVRRLNNGPVTALAINEYKQPLITTSDGDNVIQVWTIEGEKRGIPVEGPLGTLTSLSLTLKPGKYLALSQDGYLTFGKDGSSLEQNEEGAGTTVETMESLVGKGCALIARSHIFKEAEPELTPAEWSMRAEARELCDRHKTSQKSIPLTATASDWRSAFSSQSQKHAQSP